VAKLDEGGQQPQFYRMDVYGRHGAGSDEVLQSAAGVALDASQAVRRAGQAATARAGPASRQADAGTWGRRANGQSGTQCPVSLRQREEVQEMLRVPVGPMKMPDGRAATQR
jgi:hypothetical protein